MFDFHDDPDFVNELFEFVVAMETGVRPRAGRGGGRRDRRRRRGGLADRPASSTSSSFFPSRRSWSRRSRRWEPGCGCTSAATPGRSSGAWDRWNADIVDLDFLEPRWRKAGRRWGRARCCWAIIDPVRGSVTARQKALPRLVERMLPRQPDRAIIVGAGCEVPRGTPDANLRALTDFARSRSS